MPKEYQTYSEDDDLYEGPPDHIGAQANPDGMQDDPLIGTGYQDA